MASDVNINDAADIVFVHFLILNIFNKDYDFAPLAGDIASRTMVYRNFDYFLIITAGSKIKNSQYYKSIQILWFHFAPKVEIKFIFNFKV